MSDKILNRVRKMLDLANHPNTSSEEREAFLAKVDAMMVKHAIDEALLAATQSPADRRVPVSETVEMFQRDTHSYRFRTILNEVCRTVRVRCAFLASSSNNQKVTLVGYRDDVAYAQLLFTTIQYAYIAKVQPNWDPELSVGGNVYNFKVAGYDWASIYRIAAAHGVVCDQERETLWSPYDTYVRRNGLEKVKTNRFGAYRETFAESFVERICARLETMRDAAREQAASSGAELVLVHRAEEVDEEFYRLFPRQRPESEEDRQARLAAYLEQQRLEKQKHAEWLASLGPRARAAYEREQQEQRRRQAREDAAYWRQLDRENAARYDSAGQRAGRAAADSVDLNRPGTAATSADRKAL